jgi:hypothetical protein
MPPTHPAGVIAAGTEGGAVGAAAAASAQDPFLWRGLLVRKTGGRRFGAEQDAVEAHGGCAGSGCAKVSCECGGGMLCFGANVSCRCRAPATCRGPAASLERAAGGAAGSACAAHALCKLARASPAAAQAAAGCTCTTRRRRPCRRRRCAAGARTTTARSRASRGTRADPEVGGRGEGCVAARAAHARVSMQAYMRAHAKRPSPCTRRRPLPPALPLGARRHGAQRALPGRHGVRSPVGHVPREHAGRPILVPVSRDADRCGLATRQATAAPPGWGQLGVAMLQCRAGLSLARWRVDKRTLGSWDKPSWSAGALTA